MQRPRPSETLELDWKRTVHTSAYFYLLNVFISALTSPYGGESCGGETGRCVPGTETELPVSMVAHL